MKHIWIVVLIFTALFSQAQTKLRGDFKLILNLKGLKSKPENVYIRYSELLNGTRKEHYDSVAVIADQAIIKGQLTEPTEVQLYQRSKFSKEKLRKEDFFSIYLVPGETQVKLDQSFDNFSAERHLYTTSYEEYVSIQKESLKEMSGISAEMKKLDKKKDSLSFLKLSANYNAAMIKKFKMNKQFIIDHASKSPVALLAFNSILRSFTYSPEAADSLYNLLAVAFKELPTAKFIKKEIETIKSSGVGQIARDFNQPDTLGKVISLNSYKGKYVLLDFWASWCVPCRAESPALLVNYEQYKDRNFTILQVSLDTEKTKQAWLKAITVDHLSKWTHVSDLKGFDNIAARRYAVASIPQNFLIDPSGKIIAKNLRGEELAKKLAALLK